MDYKAQQQKIISEIEKSMDEIEILKKELIQVKHDKEFYKRKEDSSAFSKTLQKEIYIVKRIDSLSNEIKLLENKLSNLKNHEKTSIETKAKMKKVLSQLRLGKNRVQASKIAAVSFSEISRWYQEGKEGTNQDSMWFYRLAVMYENFYQSFFEILKKEFKKKGSVHLLSHFVPASYPQRMDKYFNEGSSLWFSRLELRGSESIYYFGMKGEIIPRLIVTFNPDKNKSNFRLYGDELLLLLKFEDINNVKKDFRVLYSKNHGDDMFYISLGKLNSGKLSKRIELLVTKYRGQFFNPLTVI